MVTLLIWISIFHQFNVMKLNSYMDTTYIIILEHQ